MKVSVYNGAGQSDYLYGLVSGLSSSPIDEIEILDINLAKPLFKDFTKIKFHDVYRYQKKGTSIFKKGLNLLRFYSLQFTHLITRKKRIIHFQWLDRYYLIDRVLLPLFARAMRHKVVLTVHNVNARKRDNNDNLYNRITLKILYSLCNHLIVHTEKSKQELADQFKVNLSKISVVQHGMNNRVTTLGLLQASARSELNITTSEKVILFFGNIDYYKGLDLLVESLEYLDPSLSSSLRLVIAGNCKNRDYIEKVKNLLNRKNLNGKVISHIRFIEDEEIERYFIAADCIILPYRDIYQSGVLFMAYNFGLPALATRVGNFENDIIHDKTGLIIESTTPQAIAQSIQTYFNSEMYENLPETRQFIKNWSYEKYSWEKIGNDTCQLYSKVMTR